MSAPVSGTGLANERTALAWHRTALAVIAGAALITRLTYDRLGLVALASFALALLLGLWVFVESHGRYAHTAGVRRRSRPRGGRAPAALVVATAAIAVTELAALLT